MVYLESTNVDSYIIAYIFKKSTASPGLSFLCLPALYHVYEFMLGIPVCNRLVYRLETQRRIEKRREEKKKEYTRTKPFGFVLLGTVFFLFAVLVPWLL